MSRIRRRPGAYLRVKKGDGFCDVPAERLVWRRHVGERSAQVGTGTPMGRAYLRDRTAATDDDNGLTTLDGIQRIREVPDASVAVIVLTAPILSDNQIA